jgi:hypothetical protein
MRIKFFNTEIFGNMHEAQVLTKHWVIYYNGYRPHNGLKHRTLVQFASKARVQRILIL